MQLVAETMAYDSDMRCTFVLGIALVMLHISTSGLMPAIRAMLTAVVGLMLSVAFNGTNTLVFLMCFAAPIALSAGMVGECLLGILIGAIACARFWIRLLQDKLLYHPRRYEDKPLWDEVFEFGGQPCAMKKVSYSISKRFLGNFEQVAFLLLPQSRDVTVIWAIHGGNAMLATDWLAHLDRMLLAIPPLGIGFLLIDYPGYGFNDGGPAPIAALKASKEALTVALAQFDVKPQVNLLGHSLGCAAMSQLAVELSRSGSPPGQLVLSAPFLDIPRMAMRVLGGLFPESIRPLFPPLLSALVPHQWDNTAQVPAAACFGWQIKIVHGSVDELVPCFMGRELYRLATMAVYGGKTVETHGLSTAELNGERGCVTGLQGDRILIRFDATFDVKALKQENLRIIDQKTSMQSVGEHTCFSTKYCEVDNAGHNDVLVKASRAYMEILQASALGSSSA
jgi:pimeloyl-ACP methyl ester carboxylesterase